MSLPWFRVDVEMVDHPKIHHLETLLGPNAGWYYLRLLSWTARYASRGRLSTFARASLERSCGWSGDVGRLVSALLEAGLLDETETGELEVHDWWEKQGAIVSKAEKDKERLREERKRRGIVARASRDGSAGVAGDVTLRDETRRVETLSSTLDLIPLEVKLPEDTPRALEEKLTDDEFQVFEHWRQTLEHPRAVASKERKRLIAKWLPVYGVARLQAAIVGCSRSPHHMGQNDRHQRYDSLELILRDAKHIEDFERLAGAA